MKRTRYLDNGGVVLHPDADVRRDELARMTYEEYLQTPEWVALRAAAIQDAGFRCQGCNTTRDLHVHHRTYDRHPLGEVEQDLVALCGPCHRAVHLVKDLRDGVLRHMEDAP